MTAYRVEIREPGRPPREVVVESAVEVGRECDGVVLSDPRTSRRHLRLVPGPDGLTVADLGSTNGTRLNGVALSSEATLAPGDTVGAGDTDIVLLATATATVTADITTSTATSTAAMPVVGAAPPPAVPRVLDELETKTTDAR